MSCCTEELVEAMRQAVMRLDPVGCGARDVKECLLCSWKSSTKANAWQHA